MYIMFPIGIMYYFGANLDSRFAVPDFWPKPGQTHTIPFEREDINDELERLKQRRLAARARRLALQNEGVDTEVTVHREAELQKPRPEILEATKVQEPERSQPMVFIERYPARTPSPCCGRCGSGTAQKEQSCQFEKELQHQVSPGYCDDHHRISRKNTFDTLTSTTCTICGKSASSMALSTPESQAPTESDINQLRKLLAGTKAKVLGPADDEYTKSIERWSRAAEKPAGIAVVPSTAHEVAVAVKFATENSFDLAVKGGGHSTSGASSTDGGILIDLGRMRDVRVDPEQKLLYVQGGCLWGDVDEAAWKYGLATVGGTVADTGVGGLTLGGGYGALSGTRGLVTDNMVGATVVLANGEVKKASRDENSELFWALLGAGQNFGVTTEFVLKAYDQGDVYMGLMLFLPTPQNIRKLVAAANDLYDVHMTSQGLKSRSAGRTNTLLALAKPPTAKGQTMILLIASSFTTEDEGKELFRDFISIGPIVNTMTMAPYPKVNNLVPATIGMRSSMKGAAFKLPIREKFVTDMLGLFDDFHASCSDAGQSIVAWELFDPSVVVANENGCFANRGYHLNSLILPSWTNSENDQKCRQWARDMSLMFKAELQAQGELASDGVEGGVGVRGHKGAVLLYGNYDVSTSLVCDLRDQN
nr:fad-linked oxidoreductase [Quercus suber]